MIPSESNPFRTPPVQWRWPIGFSKITSLANVCTPVLNPFGRSLLCRGTWIGVPRWWWLRPSLCRLSSVLIERRGWVRPSRRTPLGVAFENEVMIGVQTSPFLSHGNDFEALYSGCLFGNYLPLSFLRSSYSCGKSERWMEGRLEDNSGG